MLKGKLLLVSVAAIMALIACAPLAQAIPSVVVNGYTDKPYYKPGETVTLKFWVYNEGPEDIVLKNITIEYPWHSVLWGGNKTIKNINAALTKSQNWTYSDTITIPTDGRAGSGYVRITYTYTYGSSTPNPSTNIYLSIASVPEYFLFENMDRLVTLITVLVVLVIVGAIIIAAAIFLTMRRPEVTWKAEQKTE
jgi:hypothetical protein